MQKKIRVYGQKYNQNKVKYRLARGIIFNTFLLFLLIAEIVLGVLWAIGF